MLLFMKRSRIDSGHHQANWMGTGGTGTTMWDRPKSRQHKYARRGTKGSMDVPCMINAHPTCCPIRSMDRWIEGRLEGSRSAGPKKEARGRVGDAAGLRRIPRLPRSSAIGLKDKQHTYECKRRTPNLKNNGRLPTFRTRGAFGCCSILLGSSWQHLLPLGYDGFCQGINNQFDRRRS